MVRLKEINEEAVFTLSKLVNFSSWNGIPVARKRPDKYTFPRSPAVQVTMRRMRIAGMLTHRTSQSVRDAYKKRTKGTSYIWKDLMVKEILTIWAKTGQCPITFRHFEYEVVDGVLTIKFTVNPIFADQGNGFGLTGWGNSPYGTPAEFLTDEGYLTPVRYNLVAGDPMPWPNIGFTY